MNARLRQSALLLALLLITPLLHFAQCFVSAPYNENFDGPNWIAPASNLGSIDSCWNRTTLSTFFWGSGPGSNPSPNTGPGLFDHTIGFGQYVSTMRQSTAIGSQTADLTTPFIDLTPLDTPEFSFWHHKFGNQMGDLTVQINNGSGWSNLITILGQQQTSQSNPWQESIINLSAYIDDTIQLRFRGTRAGNFLNSEMAIDDIDIRELQTCTKPNNVIASNTTFNSANLSWTTGGATNWLIKYKEATAPVSQIAYVGAGTNPFTLSGLNPATTYQVWVRDSCGTGDVSPWTGPLLIKTSCSPVNVPYVESFDGNTFVISTQTNPSGGIDSCYTRSDVSTYYWTTGPTSFSSNSSGPGVDHTSGSGQFLFTVTTAFTNAQNTNLVTPWVDLSQSTAPELRFWYHMYGSNIDKLEVRVKRYNGSQQLLTTISGSQQSSSNAAWLEEVVNLSSFVGDTIKLELRAYSLGGLPFAEVAIDDLSIAEITACPDPTNLVANSLSNSSIELSWNSLSGFSQIEYGPTGFVPGSGTIFYPGATNPVVISGLAQGTCYDFYVRDSCTANLLSTWVGPVNKCTLNCSSSCTYNLKLTDTFGDGWTSNLAGTSFHNLDVTIGTDTTSYTLNNGNDTTIQLVVCEGDSISLFFNSNGLYSNECGVQLRNSANILIHTSSGYPASQQVYSDSVNCNTLCPAPSGFTANPFNNTSIQLIWNSPVVNSQIEYGPTGFTPGSGTLVLVGTNNSFVLSGLNQGTCYDFYIRDSCGVNNYSNWAGPINGCTRNCSNNCAYELKLTDTFGDGWISSIQGSVTYHDLDVTIGSATTSYTFQNGNDTIIPIDVCDGDTIVLFFNDNGLYQGECGVELRNSSGTLVHSSSSYSASQQIFTGSAVCNNPCTTPIASFTQSPSGLIVNFDGTNSSGDSLTYAWDYGDGNTGSGATSQHTYNQDGIYTTVLIVNDTCGQADTITNTLSVCTPFQAGFSFIQNGLTLNFDGSNTTNATSWSWNFGDGSSDTGTVVNHTYSNSGFYNVLLVASNLCGIVDSSLQTIRVCQLNVANNFSTNASGLNVSFDASGISGLGLQFAWNFGDGNSGTGVNTIHTYSADGNYNISLVVTDTCGNVDTLQQSILVCDVLNPQINFVRNGLTIDFSVNGAAGATNYSWSFGDGNTDTAAAPIHTYAATGNYNVTVVFTNFCGDLVTISKTIDLCPPPTARWSYTILSSGANGMTVQFDGTQSINASSYIWDFGDGNTNSTSATPVHTYSTPGLFYIVSLTVENDCGDQNKLESSLASIGLDEFEMQSTNVYPNPADELVKLDLPMNLSVNKVSVYSVQGVKLNPDVLIKPGMLEIETTGLANGTYVLSVTTNGDIRQYRFVVSH